MKTDEELRVLANLIRTEDCSDGMGNRASNLIKEWVGEDFEGVNTQLLSLYYTNKEDPTFVGRFLFDIGQAIGGEYSLRLYEDVIINALKTPCALTQEMAIMAIEYDRSEWAYEILEKHGESISESLIDYRAKVLNELTNELKDCKR